MKEYQFDIEKKNGMYEIRDAEYGQNIFSPIMVLPLGAFIAFYKRLSEFCHQEVIGGNSIYGNQRDMPHIYAALRDKEIQKEANTRLFMLGKSEHNSSLYEVWELILDGDTVKRFFPRNALANLVLAMAKVMKNLDDPRIKVWADYVLNKMTEDVPLDYELFATWLYYVHPETPSCYYEVVFDAWDRVDDRLTLRQNLDIAAAYIADHQHDYD